MVNHKNNPQISGINWFTPMAQPQVNQTRIILDKLYANKIDLSDYDKKPKMEKDNAFFTRALAAYYLHYRVGVPIDKSAEFVTDGFKDNGIDAIYFDDLNKTLYLVQTKFLDSGTGEPSLGDTEKFSKGVLNILQTKFDNRFNEKIRKFESLIREVFNDSETKLVIAIAYTGKGFSEHNQYAIDDLMETVNDTTEWGSFDDFNLKAIWSSLRSATMENPINYDVTLTDWGVVQEPYVSYYGQLPAYRIAEIFSKEGVKLFSDNIRGFLGFSPINLSIIDTIKNTPENFIYFNNGISIVCDSIDIIPGLSMNRMSGGFKCKGMQVINGAQTVGSLGDAIRKYEDQLKKCSVFVRLIPLDKCPSGFGHLITVASNTQNKIEKKDFVSLDQFQHNLKVDFSLNGFFYHFKRTDEPIVTDDKNCSLEEATVALACKKEDTYHAVLAKREIGKLWDDITKPPYTDLFNSDVKALPLYNAIKVFREVSKYLASNKPAKMQRLTSTYTYANYFVLNIIFALMPKEQLYNPNSNIDNYLNSDEFKALLQNIINATYIQSETHYSESLIHQLFRNFTKSADMRKRVLAFLKKKKGTIKEKNSEESIKHLS